jgi:hypothetical protein
MLAWGHWWSVALAAGITFQGATVPERASVYLPVEVRIQASGNWKNPYDPAEVSVSARVVGSRDVTADVPALWFEGYEWSDGQWTPTGERGWRLRFAPWNAGGYGLFVRGFDIDGPGELSKVSLQVSAVVKNTEPPAYGFVEPSEGRPAFTIARKEAFVPIGVYLDSLPSTPPDIERLVAKVQESGANLMSVPLYVEGWALERQLLFYDQLAAKRLDVLLEAAQQKGVRVLLRVEGGSKEGEGLPVSLRAYENPEGGACKTLDEFWTSLRARQVYKKKLRYLIARNAWRSSLFGIQFFDGVAPPSWWLDEMAQLVYDLHPYLVVQAAERNEQVAGDSMRLNLAILPSAADLRRWRERSKKPALIIPKQSDGADVRQAWRDVLAGASGAMTWGFPAAGSLGPLRDALHTLPWTTAPVDAHRIESSFAFAAALISDSAVVVYVEGAPRVESALPQTIRVPIRRNGTYESIWRDALTGETLVAAVRARWQGSAELVVPRFDSAAVCILRRVGR